MNAFDLVARILEAEGVQAQRLKAQGRSTLCAGRMPDTFYIG